MLTSTVFLLIIEIVDEVEHNKRFDGTVTEIRGWADGTVVLRPAGKPLRFMRKEILDKRIFDTLGNKLIDVVRADQQQAWLAA